MIITFWSRVSIALRWPKTIRKFTTLFTRFVFRVAADLQHNSKSWSLCFGLNKTRSRNINIYRCFVWPSSPTSTSSDTVCFACWWSSRTPFDWLTSITSVCRHMICLFSKDCSDWKLHECLIYDGRWLGMLKVKYTEDKTQCVVYTFGINVIIIYDII